MSAPEKITIDEVEYSGCRCEDCGKLMEKPAPKARVDWDKEAREIVYHRYAVNADTMTDIRQKYGFPVELDEELECIVFRVANALQAAFEKGREAR